MRRNGFAVVLVLFVVVVLGIVVFILLIKNLQTTSLTGLTSSPNPDRQKVQNITNQTAKGIAFIRGGDIWKSNPDGTDVSQVTHNAGISSVIQYKWLSYLNKVILPNRLNLGKTFQLQIVTLDLNTNKTKVIYTRKDSIAYESGGIGVDFSPIFAVSPDERYVFAYGDYTGNGHGVLIDLSTSDQTDILGDLYVAQAAFSPESKSLAITTGAYMQANNGDLKLSIISLDDKSVNKHTPKNIGSLVDWTKDGNLIFLTGDCYNNHTNCNKNPPHIFSVFSLSSQATKQLTAENIEDGNYSYLGQSPDGRQIDVLVGNGFARMVNNQPVLRGLSYLIRLNLTTGQHTDVRNFVETNEVNSPYLSEWLYTPDGNNILYNYYNSHAPYQEREIHEINENLNSSTDKVLIPNADRPQWIY